MKIFYALIILFLSSLEASSYIELTNEEEEWIKKNPIIKVGIDANWPPFDYVDKENHHQGIASEYLNKISQYSGLKFEHYPDKWEYVLKDIKEKKLDILACVAKTPQREKYLNFSQSYLDVDIVVVSKKDLEIDSFSDISNYRVALPKDNFIHEKLREKFPKIEFIFVNSNEEALKYVSYGKADIYVGNLPVVTYLINKQLLTNLEVKLKADFKQAKLSIGVSKDKKILLSIINKSLENISDFEQLKIKKKWILTSFDYDDIKSDVISLTKKEKDWLTAHGKIKIAGDTFWPPYSFIDKDGQYIGMIPDLVNLIVKNSNLKIEYMNKKNWSETIGALKDKEIDMIDAISYSESRTKFIDFSRTYFASEIVIISNTSHDKYVNSLMNIKDKKIATVKGYSVIEKIAYDYPLLHNLIEVESPIEGLKELSNSQIDYFILDIPSFEYYSKAYGLSNLKIVGPTGYTYEYGFGILKEHKELVSIMNKLLKSVSLEKKDEIYRKWIKVDYEEKIDYDLIWKIIIGALFILAGTVYWNRKLQIEIHNKEIVQKDLQKSKDFINSIMDSQESIVIVTNGYNIEQANQAFFDFTGYENLEIFKKEYHCICDLFDFQYPDKYLIPHKNNIRWVDEVLTKQNRTHKALIYKENKAHIFKVSASNISEASSLKTVVFTDITKLEELNDALVKAKDEAVNATKQKSEFLANMSHEIRTPMNSVIGFTELLDKEITNPVQRDYLGSIKKGGNALLRIINDILDLSKIEAGKLEIKSESINPRNLFFEIESIFESKIMSKNINFIVEIDESIPDYIIIDGVRLRQILFNLIGNAIKFTETGYIKLKVENLYTDNSKSKINLIFSVEDTGIGIDKEFQEVIFDAFEQQKEQSAQKYGGTGLGLAICTKLVHMMNGEISLKSKKTKGSTFTVILREIAVSSMSHEPICQKLDVTNISFERASILVVDDILENRKLVKESLKKFDFELVMAVDGKDALEKLKNVNIDLILMDLRMPVMNGYEAASVINKDEKLKEIPLIALTASVMGKDLEKVSTYGFDGYLRKPVIVDDLILEMSKYLKYNILDAVLDSPQNKDEQVTKQSLLTVLNYLDAHILIDWDMIKSSGDFMLIEDLANRLEVLGKENGVHILEEYSKNLKINIDSFDIEKVDFMLNNFMSIYEKIKELEAKFNE